MTANARSRTVILAVACLGHVGLILLLAREIDVVRRRAPAHEPEPLLVLLLESLVRPEPQPRPAGPPVLSPPTEVSPLPLPQIDAPSESSPPVSDSVPHVDWFGERQREVAAVVERQNTAAARPRIGQHPRGMDLPHEEFEHKAGVTEHYAGGETIEWINDRCYYTNKQPVIPNYFGMMLPVCKPRGNVPRKEIRIDRRPDDAE